MSIKRPCVQGLKCFEKSGCPEAGFDATTGKGCPAWREYIIGTKPPTNIKECSFLLQEHWQFESLKLLEGNQCATESLRNGLCETVGGKTVPKVDRGMLYMIGEMQKAQLDRVQLPTKPMRIPG